MYQNQDVQYIQRNYEQYKSNMKNMIISEMIYELMKNIEYGCIYNKIVLTKFMKISNLKEQL